VDLAAKHGLPEQSADFGQTLSRYGIGEGPFLVLPILGPSRRAISSATGTDLFIDPLTWLPTGWPLLDRLGVTAGVHIWDPYLTPCAQYAAEATNWKKDRWMLYATMRSIYRQQRARRDQWRQASGGGLVRTKMRGGGPLGAVRHADQRGTKRV